MKDGHALRRDHQLRPQAMGRHVRLVKQPVNRGSYGRLETDILVQLIRAKHACLTQLRDMGRRQLELVDAGNLTGLLDVLSAKQRPLAELQRVERAWTRSGRKTREGRRWQSARTARRLRRQIASMRRPARRDHRPGETQRRDAGAPPRRDRRSITGHARCRAGPWGLRRGRSCRFQSTRSTFRQVRMRP